MHFLLMFVRSDWMNAHVKHVVGESEHGSNDFFERFSTWFSEDTSPELEGSQIRRELVF